MFTTLSMIFGVILGYVIATTVEAFLHKNVQHTRRNLRNFWGYHNFIGVYFLNAYYSHHIIHHGKTFKRNFITQFNNESEKQKLDNELKTKGKLGDLIMKEKYGTSLHGIGIIMFNLPLIPFVSIIFLFCNKWVFLGSIITFFISFLLSMFVHEYIHISYKSAIKKSPYIISCLLKTKYMKAVIRNHFMHHRYPNHNFNLLLGGDYLLGYHRVPSEEDKNEMTKLGIPLD